MRCVGPAARLVGVADLAAVAQHQRILVKIRHAEVFEITRGIQGRPDGELRTAPVQQLRSPRIGSQAGSPQRLIPLLARFNSRREKRNTTEFSFNELLSKVSKRSSQRTCRFYLWPCSSTQYETIGPSSTPSSLIFVALFRRSVDCRNSAAIPIYWAGSVGERKLLDPGPLESHRQFGVREYNYRRRVQYCFTLSKCKRFS